jgi:hypothetical protein
MTFLAYERGKARNDERAGFCLATPQG